MWQDQRCRVYLKDCPDYAMVTLRYWTIKAMRHWLSKNFNIVGTYPVPYIHILLLQIRANGRRAYGFVIEVLDGHSKQNVPLLPY